ncbi:MAG: hypothetical protein QXE92_00255 [Thermofilaceae archaeon]
MESVKTITRAKKWDAVSKKDREAAGRNKRGGIFRRTSSHRRR